MTEGTGGANGVVATQPSSWDKRGSRSLFVVLSEDFRTNGRNLFLPGFQALAVHRLGEFLYDHSVPTLLAILVRPLHSAMLIYVRNILGIELNRTTRIGRRVRVHHQNGIVVHPLALIGDECILRQGVTLGGRSDNPRSPGGPVVGARVSFGVGCVVVGAVTIGDDCIIGPNAVVTSDLPSGSSVIAAPSRVLRLR